MEKAVIMLRLFGHRNKVVVKKSTPNPFFIIEKATITFQNINEFRSDSYFINKGRLSLVELKNGFDGFYQLMVNSN